jgi:hypothetical protein
MSRIEEFDDDTDLPLPSRPLPASGTGAGPAFLRQPPPEPDRSPYKTYCPPPRAAIALTARAGGR